MSNEYVWWSGLYDTLITLFRIHLRNFLKTGQLKRQFKRKESYLCQTSNETSEVWWGRENAFAKNESHKVLWIILPGGMRAGDSFYTDDGVDKLIKCEEDFCVFHNPGIVNEVLSHPPALVDTSYLGSFITKVRKKYDRILLLGFSAGGMLSISASHLVDKTVTIHSPDIIRETFEWQSQSGWLDIMFALSLYTTMKRSGAFENGFKPTSEWVWLEGFSWMKRYTERVFQTSWNDMEHLWSCRHVIANATKKGKRLNVLRVISENDPIVPFTTIDVGLSREALLKCIVLKRGGHCTVPDDAVASILEYVHSPLANLLPIGK